MQSWFEREEDLLVDELNSGKITQKEFDNAMRDMRASIHDQARQAAEDAYEWTMGNY